MPVIPGTLCHAQVPGRRPTRFWSSAGRVRAKAPGDARDVRAKHPSVSPRGKGIKSASFVFSITR